MFSLWPPADTAHTTCTASSDRMYRMYLQMYMLLIILLMLSQDTAFAQNVHKIGLPVSWAWAWG